MTEQQRIVSRRLSTSINVGLLAFVIARALVVWPTLGRYGVNPFIFLVLDILTVKPYTWGLTQLWGYTRHHVTFWRALVGGTAAIAGFTLPYVYVYMAGRGSMPLTTKVIVLLIVLFFFIVGPYRKLKNGHL